jgi:hypothetical protein
LHHLNAPVQNPKNPKEMIGITTKVAGGDYIVTWTHGDKTNASMLAMALKKLSANDILRPKVDKGVVHVLAGLHDLINRGLEH